MGRWKQQNWKVGTRDDHTLAKKHKYDIVDSLEQAATECRCDGEMRTPSGSSSSHKHFSGLWHTKRTNQNAGIVKTEVPIKSALESSLGLAQGCEEQSEQMRSTQLARGPSRFAQNWFPRPNWYWFWGCRNPSFKSGFPSESFLVRSVQIRPSL
jgi:hypothetical protein